jgi:hypothetical protein
MALSRRMFLSAAAVVPATLGASSGQGQPADATAVRPAPASFPSHDPDLAREIVSVSHGNVARVRELLAGRPALANASWDWGYGDWESALGAASHVGNREIAALLLAAGARPTIFSAAMLGHLDTVKAFVAASPGVQKTRGPHGITLLAHARAGGAASAEVVKYLEALGDAGQPYRNERLEDADRAAIAGVYAFGPEANARLTVAAGDKGLSIQRDGGAARGMLHLGARVFHPIGAEAVRIRFGSGEPAPSVTIEDGPLIVTGRRV